jgi:hypothetical protein
MRSLLALKSSDGRSHEIEAIALGRAGHTDVLYALELNSQPGFSRDGEYLLWKLDLTGKVLHKASIAKMVSREPPRVTIVPLPAPHGGAIIVGMFRDRLGWSLLRVNDAGRIETNRRLAGDAFLKAILLSNAKELLLVGWRGRDGSVWRTDLDGNVQWQKTYTREFTTERKPPARILCDIALTDDQGGFVVAGEFGELYKMGLGRPRVWLLRCDPAGNVLGETTFPGCDPLMCALGSGQFAVAHTAAAVENRVRLVDLQLREQWEKKVDIAAVWIERPAIGSVPGGRGFVVAGARPVKGGAERRCECGFFQYNALGQVVSSASSMPLASAALPQPHVSCDASRAHIAARTKGGFDPAEVHEASIWEIPLKK